MSNFSVLAKEFTKFEEASKVLETSKLKIETRLNDSMRHLHSVGNSVLRKHMGVERYKALSPSCNNSELSRKNNWLLIHDPEFSFRLWKTNSTKGEIVVKGYTLNREYLAYSMSADLLSISIRDFAKGVRNSQNEAIKDNRLREIALAHEVIQREEQRALKEQRKINSTKSSRIKSSKHSDSSEGLSNEKQ